MDQQSTLTRRLFLGAAGSLALTPWPLATAATASMVQVFKTPTCGCCTMWVEHLMTNGFAVEAEDLADLGPIKKMAGVPDHLLACHTGMIDDYTIEGHIPAAATEKLLVERPAIRGFAVPGMPAGSPGMPDPMPERYDVIAFGNGQDRVFMSFVETDSV